jgi:hypothetical protein
MAYNVSGNLRQTRPGAAYLEGRDGALRNALAERQVSSQEQNALFNQNRLTQQDQAAQQAAQQKAQEQQERAELERGHSEVLRILAAPPGQKRAVAEALFDDEDRAEFASEGIDFNTLDDDGLQQLASRLENQLGSQLGIAPAAPPKPETYTLSPGQKRFENGKEVASVAPTPPASATAGRARLLTPQEVRAAGFPDGTVAQELPDGRIDVVNKREGLSAAEQKTVREAKMRMPRLNAALRRADRLGKAVDALSNNPIFDGGPADAKALQYTKEGRELMAAAAQLMPELQALTRVPGIGSQSDLEARLASLALPSLEMDPDTNARTQAELVAFVEDLRAAYESLVQGGQEPAPAANSGGWSVEVVQ